MASLARQRCATAPWSASFASESSAELSRFIAEVRDELTLLDGRAQALGYRGIVVLFDSLTRLQGWSANWAEVLASAERTFGLYASYLELPVHVVYTVPPAMIVRLGAPIRFLPRSRVHDRHGGADREPATRRRARSCGAGCRTKR